MVWSCEVVMREGSLRELGVKEESKGRGEDEEVWTKGEEEGRQGSW